MSVVLLRVGIDTGCGGIHGALFKDGRFEFLPIPDSRGHDERTYGNTAEGTTAPLADYFPERRRASAASSPMHAIRSLRRLPTVTRLAQTRLGEAAPRRFTGVLCGLEGWATNAPQLYI